MIDGPSHWGGAAWLQVAVIVATVVILHVPLGNYLARVYTAPTSWRIEMAIYGWWGLRRTASSGGPNT